MLGTSTSVPSCLFSALSILAISTSLCLPELADLVLTRSEIPTIFLGASGSCCPGAMLTCFLFAFHGVTALAKAFIMALALDSRLLGLPTLESPAALLLSASVSKAVSSPTLPALIDCCENHQSESMLPAFFSFRVLFRPHCESVAPDSISSLRVLFTSLPKISSPRRTNSSQLLTLEFSPESFLLPVRLSFCSWLGALEVMRGVTGLEAGLVAVVVAA